MAELIKVATVDEVPPGTAKVVKARGEEIALFNVDGRFYATTNICSHRGGPLGEGEMDGNIVTCPWHGWQYDVTTGINAIFPNVKIPTYQVVVDGPDIKISLE